MWTKFDIKIKLNKMQTHEIGKKKSIKKNKINSNQKNDDQIWYKN
jgi:hypothetical protein